MIPALWNAHIDGKAKAATDGKTFAVTNPATGLEIARVADLSRADAAAAIASAHAARPAWAARTAKDRAVILRRWFDRIMIEQESLARLLTSEQGKPLSEARGEVAYGASFIEWFAEEGKRIYGDVIPSHGTDKRIVVLKQPIGVVAAITPWNFPIAMITRKVGPALAAGCSVVVKPAGETPLCALRLAELATEAGLPAGLLQVVTTTNSREVGLELTESPLIAKISFTGSTPTGKILMRQSVSTVKKMSMELGGNAPFIVFDDANIDAAVAGAIASKYRNAGQTCVCANRILVQDGVYDAFIEKYTNAVKALKVGPGDQDGINIGPLINESAIAKVEELVAEAVGRGAKVIIGGKRHSAGALFYEPTILGGATFAMQVAQDEIFGPVAPVFRFSTDAEAIKLANDTPYGLAAYFYARDIGRVWRIAEELEYGIVGINEGIISTEVAPFGGWKESGLGREGSHYGIDDFVEIKYLCMGGI